MEYAIEFGLEIGFGFLGLDLCFGLGLVFALALHLRVTLVVAVNCAIYVVLWGFVFFTWGMCVILGLGIGFGFRVGSKSRRCWWCKMAYSSYTQ